MTIEKWIYFLSDNYLFYPLLIFCGLSFLLTLKLNFIQFRTIPTMLKMLLFNQSSNNTTSQEEVSPRTALFISMSTAIGLGNIAGPIVALGFGGPAALSGFVLASMFGAATTFLEIFLALKYRTTNIHGVISGGPMQYLQKEFSLGFAKFYAAGLFVLLTFWTANQANSLAVLMNPIMPSQLITGLILSFFIMIILLGGIKRVGALNDKLVPLMCILYCACTFAVILKNLDKVPQALKMIFFFWEPAAQTAGAFAGFSLMTSFRWGISRAIQANEVGVGTATFPHSASTAKNPYYQAILGMVPVYATAFLTTMTGLTVLVTDFWKEPGITFDISMFFKIMQYYFPQVGPIALLSCGFLFGFGTILGNCYNASKCFQFLFRNSNLIPCYILSSIAIALGSISHLKLVWSIVDFFVLPVAIPHMIAIFIIAFRTNIFKKNSTQG